MYTNIYLGGPITGLSYQEATEWRTDLAKIVLVNSVLRDSLRFISPLRGKEYLSGETQLGQSYEEHIMSTAKNIVIRDLFDINRCGICVFNFLGAKQVSIGSVCEIGYAKKNGSLIIVAMEKDNCHQHPFITEGNIIVDNLNELVVALLKIV